MNRCKWCNLKNELYVAYHDKEWAVPVYDDKKLFEQLILELFQSGLSWETVLNKRSFFREAFDGFDVQKVALYSKADIDRLMNNANIIRNRKKIEAAIKNAKVFIEIQTEWGGFHKYIWSFTNGGVVCENDKTRSQLSDILSKDLKRRGMSFVGSTVAYSYLQSIGVINSHDNECYLFKCR